MQADWCKDFCPELAVFNKIYINRKGKGLFSHIKFIGEPESVECVIENEMELFSDKDINCILTADKENMAEEPNTIYIHTNGCSHNKVNSFDVSGFKNPAIETLFDAIGLDCSKINKDEIYKQYHLQDIDNETIVNNVLLSHYSNSDDDVLTEKDFLWAEKDAVPENIVSEDTVAENVTAKEIVKDATPENENKEKDTFKLTSDVVLETEKTLEKVSDVINKSAEHSSIKDKAVEPVELENKLDKPVKIKPDKEIPKPQDVPKPAKEKVSNVSEEKTSDKKNKRGLSKEEKENNKKELDKIKVLYKETIDYIVGLKNARWNVMLNKMRDCLKTNKFNQQWCVMYLNISDDVTSELYAKLYDVDEKTKEFHTAVVHQIEHMTCPICGEESDEDITFLPEGVHFIECPHCYAKRGIEKK